MIYLGRNNKSRNPRDQSNLKITYFYRFIENSTIRNCQRIEKVYQKMNPMVPCFEDLGLFSSRHRRKARFIELVTRRHRGEEHVVSDRKAIIVMITMFSSSHQWTKHVTNSQVWKSNFSGRHNYLLSR